MEDIELTELTKVLEKYAQEFEAVTKRKLIDNDNVATGDLLRSISARVEMDGYIYTVYLDSLEYLKYLEEGTRPHFPPIAPLMKWVRAKRLPSRDNTGDKRLPSEKQIAFAVAHKIAEEGTEPQDIVAKTQKEVNEKYLPKLEEALTKDVVKWLPIIRIELRFV